MTGGGQPQGGGSWKQEWGLQNRPQSWLWLPHCFTYSVPSEKKLRVGEQALSWNHAEAPRQECGARPHIIMNTIKGCVIAANQSRVTAMRTRTAAAHNKGLGVKIERGIDRKVLLIQLIEKNGNTKQSIKLLKPQNPEVGLTKKWFICV